MDSLTASEATSWEANKAAAKAADLAALQAEVAGTPGTTPEEEVKAEEEKAPKPKEAAAEKPKGEEPPKPEASEEPEVKADDADKEKAEEPAEEKQTRQITAALNQARAAERQARGEVRELKSQMDSLQNMLNQLVDRSPDQAAPVNGLAQPVNGQVAQAGGLPPREQAMANPMDFIGWIYDTVASERQTKLQQTQERQQAAQRQKAAAQRMDALRQEVAGYEADFRIKSPDYDDAFNYALESTKAEYQMMGYSQQNAHNYSLQDGFRIAEQALAEGKDPAEVIYNYAKGRGYQTPAPEPAPTTANDQLDRIAEAKRMAGAQSSGGSTNAVTTPTLAWVAEVAEGSRGANPKEYSKRMAAYKAHRKRAARGNPNAIG